EAKAISIGLLEIATLSEVAEHRLATRDRISGFEVVVGLALRGHRLRGLQRAPARPAGRADAGEDKQRGQRAETNLPCAPERALVGFHVGLRKQRQRRLETLIGRASQRARRHERHRAWYCAGALQPAFEIVP